MQECKVAKVAGRDLFISQQAFLSRPSHTYLAMYFR
jgi:hypothetical protein